MKKRSWTEKQLRQAVKKSKSIRQVLRGLNLRMAGGNYAQIKKYLKLYGIDTKHFAGQGWHKGMRGIGKPLIKLEDILVRNSDFQSFKLKKSIFLAKLKPQHCEFCAWNEKSRDGRCPRGLA